MRRKSNAKWFALMGYNKDNEDEVGLLGFDESSKNPYKIVKDISDALKFPTKNTTSKKGFATPEKWLEFFNTEPLLKGWKFHLIGVKQPAS